MQIQRIINFGNTKFQPQNEYNQQLNYRTNINTPNDSVSFGMGIHDIEPGTMDLIKTAIELLNKNKKAPLNGTTMLHTGPATQFKRIAENRYAIISTSIENPLSNVVYGFRNTEKGEGYKPESCMWITRTNPYAYSDKLNPSEIAEWNKNVTKILFEIIGSISK